METAEKSVGEAVDEPGRRFVPIPTAEDRARGRAVRQDKLQAWAKLDLKLDWLDAETMRENLHAAGLRMLPPENEPPSVARVRQLARRISLTDFDIRERTGLPTAEWIARNPRTPLWVLLAHLAEMA